MRVVLTHGYFLFEDAKEQQIMKPYVPLGILYLSSHLRQKGFDVEIYDSTFGSKHELFSILREGPAGIIGIYGNLMTRPNVLEIMGYARKAGWKVMVGGPEPPNYSEQYLDAGADVVIAGEAELTLENLLQSRFDPAKWAEIGGLIFRSAEGNIVRTPGPSLIKNLDAQPWPDRERVDIERYLGVWRKHHGKGSVSLITARGCPYHCNWCSHSVFGKSHRRRSPMAVVDEVEWILQRYSPDMLWLADDVFTIHHGWLFEYAAEMKKRGLRIPFECITRADRLNERVAETLADLGCFRVWIGSESGSQRILDAMQRGVTVDQVRTAARLCKQSGIQIGMFLMWGYEGEDIEDIEMTVQHVKQCQPDVCFTTVSYPIKGTPYYERVSPRLIHLGEWSRSTDRDLRIQGRHSRRFYQHADDLLKSELAASPDPGRVLAAREGLRASWSDIEA
ncbi:MAG: B12-binding domain-containing radical SAM protein [Acidobacteriaceae bacterium]|nr:B12-binding domain-containing radical SAM protein [Acidobacteriaceae bacterium]